MAVQVDAVLDSVSITLLDTARRAWTLPDLIGYLNEALAATAGVRPTMHPKTIEHSLEAGITQTIPTDGVAILDVGYNIASGRVVRQVDRELLDEANRFWPGATQEVDVWEYAADPRDRKRFDVTPPNDGTGVVHVMYGAVPATVTGSSGESIDVSPDFLPILIEYVLHRCYAMSSKSQDLTKSNMHKQQWASMVGLGAQAQAAAAPKVAVSEGKG